MVCFACLRLHLEHLLSSLNYVAQGRGTEPLKASPARMRVEMIMLLVTLTTVAMYHRNELLAHTPYPQPGDALCCADQSAVFRTLQRSRNYTLADNFYFSAVS